MKLRTYLRRVKRTGKLPSSTGWESHWHAYACLRGLVETLDGETWQLTARGRDACAPVIFSLDSRIYRGMFDEKPAQTLAPNLRGKRNHGKRKH